MYRKTKIQDSDTLRQHNVPAPPPPFYVPDPQNREILLDFHSALLDTWKIQKDKVTLELLVRPLSHPRTH